MAKKTTTVGDLARIAAAGHTAQPAADGFDVKQIVFALLVGLTLAAAAALGLQSVAALRAAMNSGSAQTSSIALAAEFSAEISAVQKKLDAVVDGKTAFELASQAEDFDQVKANATMLALLDGATDVELLRGADVNTALGNRFAQFGYAKLDLLLEAQRTGKRADAQVHMEANKNFSLVVAEPIVRDDVVIGFLLAKFPCEAIKTLNTLNPDGFVDLQQRGMSALASVQRVGSAGPISGTLPIQNSRLTIGWGTQEPFKFFGMEGWLAPLLATLGALCVLGGLFFIRSRPRLFGDMAQKFQRAETDVKANDARPTGAKQTLRLAEATAVKLQQVSASEKAAALAQAEEDFAAGDNNKPRAPSIAIDPSIFRAYDIRGIVGAGLTEPVVELIGRALGTEVLLKGLREMVVARDGRLSGPALSSALIRGIRGTGCDVIDIGAVPTPVLYFGTHHLQTGCGVMVTGSHNPPDYNGLKMVINGETLAEESIQALYKRISTSDFQTGKGSLQVNDISEAYIDKISADIQLENPLRVVIDAGNGIAGIIAPKLLQSVGCEVEELYCEVDGNFPNHHPDPSEPKNLRDLMVVVKQVNADIGLAFDGDGDRLGVVTRSGKIIYPDRILMLFAQDVLSRCPGASIIFDVKCTGALNNSIRAAGGVPIMWKTGHSLIKKKMRETGAELAGEMSGHFFFKERWYGFDDGMYAACRLMEILAASGMDCDELFDDIPNAISTPELKIQMQEGEHYRYMDKFIKKAKFDDARINLIDGVRADFDDGWGLVRCSNTTPCLVLRFEGQSDAALRRIQGLFRTQLLALDSRLELPF